MEKDTDFEIFLIATPGLEAPLAAEAQFNGFSQVKTIPGGVICRGSWSEVWRANLTLRGANKVLVRLGSFPAVHLAQLDKRARKFPWGEFLRSDVPVKVEATSRKSRIYHAGAARQRIEHAISESLGVPISSDAEIRILLRIEKDICTISVDSSGAVAGHSRHSRGIQICAPEYRPSRSLAGRTPLLQSAVDRAGCGLGYRQVPFYLAADGPAVLAIV